MKILVADDSRTMRRVFRTLLESMGHASADIYEANDAIEAISLLKIRKYDVDYIIADYDMAGMENHGFLHRLKQDCPGKIIPVLMCINANQRMVAAESIRHGATLLLAGVAVPERTLEEHRRAVPDRFGRDHPLVRVDAHQDGNALLRAVLLEP